MKASLRRAMEAHDRAECCLAENGLSDTVRANLASAKVLAGLAILAFKSGRLLPAERGLAVAERALSTAINQHTWPLAQHGASFRPKPGQRRLDALGRLILNALNELDERASSKEILRHIEKHGADVIDEIDDRTIYWGRDKETSLKRFADRISFYRKKYFPVID